MSDEIAEFVSAKLTKGQKRGMKPGTATNREFHNDRRIVDMPSKRSEQELRNAQINLAGLAMEHPGLVTDLDRQRWLAEVLDSLGLGTRVVVKRQKAEAECGDYRGTKQGYNIHLRGYTRACDPCMKFHREEMIEDMTRRFGFSMAGVETWKFQWS